MSPLSLLGVGLTTGNAPSHYQALPDISLQPGESLAIIGSDSRCRSDLLLKLGGLLASVTPGKVLWDRREIDTLGSRAIARRIAYVPSKPNLLFSGLGDTVQEEMELSFQFLGERPDTESLRRARCIDALGIIGLLSRQIGTLSGGEAMLAAIAVAVVKGPELILLEDTYAFLHPESRSRLRGYLKELVEGGVVLIETHPTPPEWSAEFDLCLHLGGPPLLCHQRDLWPRRRELPGTLFSPLERATYDLEKRLNLPPLPYPADTQSAAASVSSALGESKSRPPSAIGEPACHSRPVVLEVKDLCFEHRGGFKLGPVSMAVKTGDIVALVGKNGAGKTTLLRSIAYLLEPTSGSISVGFGNDAKRPPARRLRHRWARQAIYCFQDPDDQLYLPSVMHELQSVAHACRRPVDRAEVLSVAEQLGLSPLLDESPVELSFSQRRLVTLASAFLAAPHVLLLDEPSGGLDYIQTRGLTRILRAHAARGGVCLLVSHDTEFWFDLANSAAVIEAGQLSWMGPVTGIAGQLSEWYWSTAATLWSSVDTGRAMRPSS